MKQLTVFFLFAMMTIGGWAEGVAVSHDLSETNKDLRTHTHEPVLSADQKYSDELLKKAESGDSTAQRNLGSCYYYGLGVGKDLTKAIELWGKAASQGDIKAQTNLGSLYLKEQKYDKAYVWFKKASDSGDVHAMNNLGSLYNAGLGVQKNETEGFRLHQKAAGQKDPCALYNLAVDYETGRGTDKNIQMAIKAYAEAASAGSSEAQYDLGILYFDGKGVPQNNQKAFELFNMAAAQNHQKAKDMLPMLKTLIKPQSTTNLQQNP
jgi:TPR repeat protein